MSAIAVSPAYTALLLKFPPMIIRSDAQNQSYIDALYELEQHHASLSAEETELADLLTLLVEDYEEKHFAIPRSSPREVLLFLMDQHGLTGRDLADDVARALSGEREFSTEIIRRLSEQFGVSPEIFF